MKLVLIILLAVIVGLVLFSGTIMSQVKEPKYKVISKKDNIEVREYSPFLIAEIMVHGDRKDAIGQGFKSLADYIFGDNTKSEKMQMTAPVIQEAAPSDQGKNSWKIRFVMPDNFTMQDIPKPKSSSILLIENPKKMYVVIVFSGMADDEMLTKNRKELDAFVKSSKLDIQGEPLFAFYNPPWTLPFMRRNEILYELKSS